MAQMYPPVFPCTITKEEVERRKQEAQADPDNQEKKADFRRAQDKLLGEDGEAFVFECFRTKTPDEWHIFHSVPIYGRASKNADGMAYDPNGKRHLERELDFLVLIPDKGFCVIEVKNYLRRYDSPLPNPAVEPGDGTDAHDTWKRSWPHMQARSAMHDFANWLSKICGFEQKYDRLLPYESGVLMAGEFATEHDKKDAIYSELYLCGRSKIERASSLKNFIEGRLNQPVYDVNLVNEQLEAIKTRLISCGIFKKSIDDYERIFNQAISRIDHVLPMLSASVDGIEVKGCAGSGKTVMALTEASRLARQGKKVLYLCFNKNLSAWLRRDKLVADIANIPRYGEGRLDLYHFHDFCHKVLKKSFNDDELLNRQDGALKHEEECEYERIITNRGIFYDYLFVDEAQDFKNGYWTLLEYLVNSAGRRFFYDENQRVRPDSDSPPRPATRLELTTNLRNSKEISLYGASVLPESHIDSLDLKCQDVEVCEAKRSVEERAEAVSSIILDKILGNKMLFEKATMSQIVILSPWSRYGQRVADNSFAAINKCLKQKKDNGIIKERLYLALPDDEAYKNQYEKRLDDTIFKKNGKRAFADTIKSFKGLEANYVILTDVPVPSPESGFDIDDFYVACTRAKYGLYIIPMTREAEEVARTHLPHKD